MKRRDTTFIIVALILGAVLGGLVGDIVGTFLPDGAAKTVFTKSIPIGFDTFKIELYTIALTIGLTLKINFMSMLVVILVIIYFRWWYL